MKKVQILIITLVAILTIGIGTFAVIYFATDMFKSEQEMFYKYAGQLDFKEFIDLQSYNTYSEKLKTTGHEDEGELTIELTQGEQTISESIKYNGYSDQVNKTANYDISINKDNETLLAMNYLKQQDLNGLLFKDVVKQYIVVENNNLKEFASKMGVEDTRYIPNKIEITESNINYEELNTILNTYLNIAMEEIPEENYSKIKKQEISLADGTVEADGYQVNLKVKDVQKIFTKVLENAKNDEQLFNLLNSEDMTFEDYQVAIDELLVGLSQEIPSEENVELIRISVYKQGKNTVKFSVQLTTDEEVNLEISIKNTSKGMMIKFTNIETNYDETKTENIITITKTANSEEQENFELVATERNDEEQIELSRINLSRNGALTSNNVMFDFSIVTNLDMSLFTDGIASLRIEMQNNTNFAGVPKEGEFVQGNHLVINELTQEQLTNLFTNLGTLLGEKLEDEMFVTLITNLTTLNNQLIENTEQTMQETQDALELESQLNSGMIEIDGVQYTQEEIMSQYY